MKDVNWALSRKQETLAKRAAIVRGIRDFFTRRGYLEIETPLRIPANAPEVHIDQVESGGWVLHTSPEIAMKRLLAAGYEKIFQICKVWRDGERGQRHLPEFTMLEWYRANIDYNGLMSECEELLVALVPEGVLSCGEVRIDLSLPWPRLTVAEAFERYASINLQKAIAEDRFEEILCNEVEPSLGRDKPTFLTEYPASMAALARTKPGDATVAERFELYIDGLEVANAFSELIDPREQRERFQKDEDARQGAGKSPYPLPEKFLDEMHNMPEAAGIALGLDRLVMLLTGAEQIDDVVAFTPDSL